MSAETRPNRGVQEHADDAEAGAAQDEHSSRHRAAAGGRPIGEYRLPDDLTDDDDRSSEQAAENNAFGIHESLRPLG
jgi:hypothetical protein